MVVAWWAPRNEKLLRVITTECFVWKGGMKRAKSCEKKKCACFAGAVGSFSNKPLLPKKTQTLPYLFKRFHYSLLTETFTDGCVQSRTSTIGC